MACEPPFDELENELYEKKRTATYTYKKCRNLSILFAAITAICLSFLDKEVLVDGPSTLEEKIVFLFMLLSAIFCVFSFLNMMFYREER